MSLRTALAALTLATVGLSGGALPGTAVSARGDAAPVNATQGSSTAAIGGLSEIHELQAAPVTTGTTKPVARPAKKRLVADHSRSYAFSAMLDGKPIRWNPCSSITWVSNTAKGPAGGLQVLRESVAKVAAVTGTTWVYGGEVTDTATSAYLPAAAGDYPPVLLGWTDGASSDLLKGRPANVLAVARTAWFGTDNGAGERLAATRAAVVAFDRTDKLPLRGATSWSAVALHELGHVFGLEHVQDATQLMSATLPRGLTELQAGDRAGLTKLGRASGCVEVPGA